jgi:hypothetical protein
MAKPRNNSASESEKILFTVMPEDRGHLAQIEVTLMRKYGMTDCKELKHSEVIRYALKRAATADRRRVCLKSQ